MRRLATTFVVVFLLAIPAAPVAFAESEEPPVEEPAVEEPAVEEPVVAEVAEPKPAPRRPPRVRRVKVTRDIVFPIVGATRSINGFGSCRDNCTREHHGVDILTYYWKGLPVVAAHDGVVTEVRDDGEWCNVQITGDDGWYTRYVHLNNDSPGYDDEDYYCLPPGITTGERVEAGQLIGWVGDSGNAEHTQPHIHFEIRMPSGLPVDPLASLKAAREITLRQVGAGDAAATAAEIATYAYPEGAPTVTVMAIDEYLAMREGGYEALHLDGPLLLSEWEVIPGPTLGAIDALGPARVVVIGDLWMPDVLDQLRGSMELIEGSLPDRSVATALSRGRTIEETTAPETQTDVFADGIGSALAPPEWEQKPAPFSIVLLGDHEELGDPERAAFGALTERVATTVMDYVEPDGRIGNAAFEGIGRSGSRYTLYYPAGGEWIRYRAREAPEEAPGYGVFVVESAHLTAETLAFLDSIADAPVMPLWR